MKIEDNRVVLSFDHSKGLTTRDGKLLDWFEIAGADGQYPPAQASIEGRKVVVRSPEVVAPHSARFGWNEAAQPNLVNGARLPAAPFRSEHPIPTSDLARQP